MSRKYFGTDGIRGRVGEFPITPDFVLKLGWAVGMAFRRQGNCRVLIGKDTRSSGYMFESAFEAGLSASGADTLLLGPMPTPGIAYLTRTFHAEVWVVISASHNPHDDNGIKFFSGQGTKLPDDVELMIEELLDAPMTVVESARLGKVSRINDAAGRYIEFCKSSVPTSTDFNGLKVVLDCANGATYKIAPSVFRELGAEVTVLAASPNGLNINDKCGSTHLDGLQAAVVEHHADLGIAFDGDGDRVMMVDHTGAVVDGDELLFPHRARPAGKRAAARWCGRHPDEQPRPGAGFAGTAYPVRAGEGRRSLCDGRTAGSELDAGRGEFGAYRLLPEHHDGRCHHRGATGADGAQASRPDPGRGAPGFASAPRC